MPLNLRLTTAGQVLLGGVVFVVLSALIFWPLEELFEGDHAKRPTLKDLAQLWFYQSYGLWIAAGIVYELAYLVRQALPEGWRDLVAHQPYWLQATAALLMAEAWVYAFHRLAHHVPILWRFHRVHHTLVDMTWSAAARQHPVDFLLIIVGANLPALILGIDLRPIFILLIFERFYTVLLHSDLELDYGPLTRIVASPRLHRMHHDPKIRGNYSGILSVFDVLGRTYLSPSREAVSGLSEEPSTIREA